MKKLLSILGSISLVSFSSSSVVSCKNNSSKLIDIIFTWKNKEVSEIYFRNDEENKELTIYYNKEVKKLLCIDEIDNKYIKISDINYQKHTITFELKKKEKFENKQKFTFMGINSREKEIYISYREFWDIDIKTKKEDIKIIDNVSEDKEEEKFETTYSDKIKDLECTNLDKYKDLIDVETKNSKITCRWIKKNLIDKEIPKSINLTFNADNAKKEETISLKIIDERKEINFKEKEWKFDGNMGEKIFGYNKEINNLKYIEKEELKDILYVKPNDENKNVSIKIKNNNYFLEKINDKDIELEFKADNSKKNEKILIKDIRSNIDFEIKYPDKNEQEKNPSEIRLPYYNNKFYFNISNNFEKFQFVTVNIKKQKDFNIDIKHIEEINKDLKDLVLIKFLSSKNDGFITFTVNIKKNDLTKKDIEELKGKEFVISDKNNKFKTKKIKINVDDKRYQKKDWLLTKTINFNIVEKYRDDLYPTKPGNGYLVIVNEDLRNLIEGSKNIENASALVDFNKSIKEETLFEDEALDFIKFKHLFSYNDFSEYEIKSIGQENNCERNGQTKEGNFKPNDKVRALRISLKSINEINGLQEDEDRKNFLKGIRSLINEKKIAIDLKLKIESIKVLTDYYSDEIRFVAGPKWPKE